MFQVILSQERNSITSCLKLLYEQGMGQKKSAIKN